MEPSLDLRIFGTMKTQTAREGYQWLGSCDPRAGGALTGMDVGENITVRVTPRASRARIVEGAEGLQVYVTVPPEDGKANAAVQKALAKHLGIAKSALRLIRGAKSREKTFERV